MSELSGVLDVAVNNEAGFFALSAETQSLLFYALGIVANYKNWLSSPLDELTDADKAQIDDLIEFASYEVMNNVQPTPIGSSMEWWTATAPEKWLFLDGQSLLRADYPELFAILGTFFGEEDGTHFNLPDGRGRIMFGKTPSGSPIGSTGGAFTQTLGVNNLPAHHHTQHIGNNVDMRAFVAGGSGTLTATGAATSSTNPMVTGDTGAGDAFSILPPIISCRYIIYAGR